MVDGVEVRLGAETGPATQGMSDAATSIKASLDGIQRALENFSAQNKRAREDSEKNNAEIARAFKHMSEQAKGAFEGVSGAIEKFKLIAGGLAAIIGGGMLWKESINALLHEEEAVRGLQIAFGTTAEKATLMNVQLQLAGSSAETFEGMAFRVGRVLKTQADEFDRLKVVTKDANGALLPMDTILENIYKRMQDFKAGTDQNLFALSTVGRQAKDFASDMERLGRVQERARQLQHDLNIEMGPERQAQIEAYRVEVNAFSIVMEEIGQKIGEVVLPYLIELAKYFNETGPSAMTAIVKAIVVVIATIDTLATGMKEFGIWSKSVIDNLVIEWQAAGEIIKAAATLQWAEIPEIIDRAHRKILANTLRANAEIMGLEADLIKRLNDLSAEPGKIPTAPGGPVIPRSGKESFSFKPTGGDTRLEAWKDELRAMQEAEGFFHEFSKAQEAAFWESKLALVRGKGAEDVKLRRDLQRMIFDDKKAAAREELEADLSRMQQQIDEAKFNRDRQVSIAVARTALIKATFGEESKEFARALDEETRIRQAWAAKDVEIMRIRSGMAQAQATHEIAMEKLALDQGVAMRQVSSQQKFAIEQELENRIYAMQLEALEAERAALADDIVAVEKVNAKIEALEESHQERLTKISNDAALDRAQFMLQAEQAVENTFSTLLSDLMNRTKSWKDIMLDAVNSITKALNDLVAKKLAQQLFGAGTGGGDLLGTILGGLFGGGEAPVPSFDVGTPYVPRDTLALVHRGERIIPAAQNKGGGQGSPFSVTNHFHIAGPVDSRTQDQIAAAAARATQRAMYRNL